MTLWPAVAECITVATGASFVVRDASTLGGGCVNSAYVVTDGAQRYFVKVNDAHCATMFAAEAAGLAELARPQILRVPTPIGTGTSGKHAFLVLEYLDLVHSTRASMAQMGRSLAMLHRTMRDDFGWSMTNTIGLTPQHNPVTRDWTAFWGKYRLGFQLQLVQRETALARRGEKLLAVLPTFFSGYQARPSLVHGDLWHGNTAVTRTGTPVLFDPAVYYGDHEVDLAMAELFGGFDESFFAAYYEIWPRASGYSVRKQLYNLYHILNHFVLFGGSYGQQAARMMDSLLAEAGDGT